MQRAVPPNAPLDGSLPSHGSPGHGSPSHVRGATEVPLSDGTIGGLLARVAATDGDRDAVVSVRQGIRWTYAELDRRTNEFAAGLLALGLRPGDRIGMWAPNCAEWVVVQFATARAGLILVNVNPAYRGDELGYVLDTTGCRALITAVRFKTSDYLAILRELVPELAGGGPIPVSRQAAALRYVVTLGDGFHPGCVRFTDVAALADGAWFACMQEAAAAVRADHAANIQFTSGTTGRPKAPTLSHRNLVNNGFFIGEATGLRAGSRLCIPVPLFHCFGMVIGNLACVTHAATMVYPGEAFDPVAVLQTVADERCDALHGVPTMFIALLNHPEFSRFDLSGLRRGVMGGAPCPIEVMREVVDRMHMREVTIAYGMTETSPISFQSGRDDPLELRVSTVGRVQPHLEVKIVDADGRSVPRGAMGELCTRGYSVMLGYWQDEARTREVLDADGWMHTGDLATLDEDGYCRIVGRRDDMIIRGGENISPREVEEFLHRHPAVRDVQVVGVPDPHFGQELCAFVILRAGTQADEEDIRGFCRGRISHFKIPRHVRFVSSFPSTLSGKVQKFALRRAVAVEADAPAGPRSGSLA